MQENRQRWGGDGGMEEPDEAQRQQAEGNEVLGGEVVKDDQGSGEGDQPEAHGGIRGDVAVDLAAEEGKHGKQGADDMSGAKADASAGEGPVGGDLTIASPIDDVV